MQKRAALVDVLYFGKTKLSLYSRSWNKYIAKGWWSNLIEAQH